MTGDDARRGGVAVIAVAALVVVAAAATTRTEETTDVPPEAARWYGAMSLYRALAVWAGKRAMSAELNYWKATAR
ncbi:hypothetical protein ACWC9H_35420 [Streptomyces sp. NPDC001251]